MASIIRLLIGIPIASVVTFLLFLLMDRLIFTDELELEDESEDIVISIAEEVDELQANVRELTIDDVPEVTPPPPPPQIERQAAEQPNEDMSTIVGEIPEFEAPTLSGNDVNFSVSDRDAQPLVRIEPQYPMRAAERGVRRLAAHQGVLPAPLEHGRRGQRRGGAAVRGAGGPHQRRAPRLRGHAPQAAAREPRHRQRGCRWPP